MNCISNQRNLSIKNTLKKKKKRKEGKNLFESKQTFITRASGEWKGSSDAEWSSS